MASVSIPFLSLAFQHQVIDAQVNDAWQRVYQQNNFILGPSVAAFEKDYAAYHDLAFCIGTGNGLDAMVLSLLACGLQAGDEVIVPAHTYLATWLAVSRAGATIVPVEPDEQTFTIDVAKIEAAITSRTKVILPVHLYGQSCNMPAMLAIAERYALKIVEDNAQAHGARWGGRLTGTWGYANATSFYPTKNLGALGDGGAVTTRHEDAAVFVRQHRNYGLSEKNRMKTLGINSRLDELQAAFLQVKLNYLDTWNAERVNLANQYTEALRDIETITLPTIAPEAHAVFHLYVIRTAQRDGLQNFLKQQGIETAVHYPVPPHRQESYQSLNFTKGSFPITERIAETCLSLPLWPGMSRQQVEYVCEKIRKWSAGK